MPPDNQMQLFELTPEEWRERSKRLGTKVQEYKRVEANKKAMVKEMNGQLKELRKEIEELADGVVFGKEWRAVVDGGGDIPPEWDR
jgi:chromosome segregation ATPase